MSDQAIIALVVGVAGGMGALVFFLFKNIKDSMNALLGKIDTFVKEVASIREEQAIKSTVLTYMQKELEIVKAQCWRCREDNKGR